ncbi:MAG: hypothetical protein COC04_01310 [Gammaproteobacteria bacterium]|nr:MAG: hypothetical protein COC04_01310 [Gammaproteobacteria bacterium]
MNILKKIVLVAVLVSTANFAFAAGKISKSKIVAVAFQSGGFFLYGNDWGNPNNCTRSNAIVLLASDSNYDKAYALLLAAYASGKSVKGYSNGCADFDGQTYNTIRGYKYLFVSD